MVNFTLIVFKYLKKEGIRINETEFEYQYKSHPNYPSLLAITDTLEFFNISNGALKVGVEDIDLLPDFFIASLKEDDETFFSFIEKKGTVYHCITGDEKTVKKRSKNDLALLWDDIIFLIEKNNIVSSKEMDNRNYQFLPYLYVAVLLGISFYSFTSIWESIFIIFPILGFIFSLGALKDIFSTKSELLNKFCNLTSSNNCDAVLSSSKWKLFEKINFSDLSLVFFSVQIMAFLIMGFTNSYTDYFSIQSVLLFLAIPVVLLSLYYQKFVEKKWCPICISISILILIELGYIALFSKDIIQNILIDSLLIYLFVASSIIVSWVALKRVLVRLNLLSKRELKANQFKRNYKLFKNNVLSSKHYNLPESKLLFGNDSAKLKISMITSPFCSFCEDPHFMLKDILSKNPDNVSVSLLYNVNVKEDKDTNKKLVFQNLVNLKLEEGDVKFHEAIDYWYEHKDTVDWLHKYGTEFESEKVNLILNSQHEWAIENKLIFTPCIFINGYKFPDGYDPLDLEFFVGELIDDEF